MKHRLLYIPIAFLFLLSFVDCAKKGTPSGGPRDTIPPIIVRSTPENYSTYFSGDEIEIRFNEYIKLKEIDKQLVISPPMKYKPLITPLSTSKILKIKILDTLKPNTTYSFNFGKSIVDNNEGNPYEYYKYVFSTGSYIDSLTVSGNVKDALLITPEIPTTVVLYEANETYKDSLIFSEKPTYVTVTQDSTGFFELTNLKEGKYFLLALKEKNNDYIFQPNTDKIGFVEGAITVPTDSTYSLTLFKENPSYKLTRPSQAGKNHIVFGYEGNDEDPQIEILSQTPDDYTTKIYKDDKRDTLNYWFKPVIETDSLVFRVSNKSTVDTVTVRMKELYADSLKISAVKSGTLKLNDTFKLRSNIPIIDYDTEKFQVMKRDSSFLEPSMKLVSKYNWVEMYFPKEEDQTYTIKVFPGAFTDFFEHTNDTLQYKINTQSSGEYGTLNLTLLNVSRFPIIVQMVNSKFNVVSQEYLPDMTDSVSDKSVVFFDELSPDKYYIRIIYDDNENRKWDTGNFLERRPPEQVIYYPSVIEVRANWSLNETFILK
ncbi:Ig-like domain-containing domain [Aequorivita ciconiae]|uniref:Ig-like domain-containing protein n=1 Tax=Aequorivita ciconiae TaxID=2494375 RepID=UPI0013E40784|nr:Ig-like domain-containing protein [Aequorivita sp. H23M31]